MKISSLFFAVLSYAVSLNAQTTLNFYNLANMNVGRGAIACAANSTSFYVSNGFSSSSAYTSICEKYDIAGNTWSQLTNQLVPKRFPSSVVVGNNLYIVNGQLSGGAYNDKVEVVDLSTGQIMLSTTNPYPSKSSGIAVWNGDIYVFGGSIGSTAFSNKLYKFDTSTQTWTQLASMLEAKETTGEIVNGKLYVIGGFFGTASSNRIDVYDIATNTWSNLMLMNTAMSAHSTATYGSRVYTAFDYTNETFLGYYDISSNTYTTLQQNNMRGRRNGGARIVNGKLYIMGGDTTSSIGSSLANLQVADINNLVGIEEFNNNANDYFYPNPASDALFLEGFAQISAFSIVDLSGKVVLSQRMPEERVDLSGLAKGVYIVKIETEDRLSVSRLVKL
jgi:N-acetylneuraminic acid mutarotase